MPRLAGVDIPENKRVEASLQYIYGVGRINVRGILEKAKVDGNKRTNQLALEELSRLQKVLDEVKVEGDLRKAIGQNISRLKETGSYRGIRHARGLPARGQRTRTNARTKRGKRMTIGALKKEALAKVEASKVEKAKKEEKK
ncbi:MAG: 30S ribosomal protein S13 [Candidatus Amesbacteria bacterium GW2011_GWB1_47_19]|nr:MAG: 30S ribosomal protein S13 [Candidatus Amesbacteria bacterium GW2011_GWA1_44_24]KKU32048.1 MAG: ribosomal protein S13, small subunit ribosomal protein S13 [Candidatus Amesbacteria bacterium GW2011_GWC1_46_24]KKU67732.1 MAG: 30S ribosomal protein S13 [Candidatus Amesbacteria bacterium GW2011_GWB1_47_19]OGD06083.1 MAG: 30S ribosomal protein S13 [Candidatus Amesbacteria bacterium RIFOXYB1_FULL_47_13]HBC72327.1 30S ribosomal protein S13 [Candidatus Amesbacteria bacterium]